MARLVYKQTGIEVKVGDTVAMSDGSVVTVTYFRPPHKSSSSGSVTARPLGKKSGDREFFVTVIGAEWIERTDR